SVDLARRALHPLAELGGDQVVLAPALDGAPDQFLVLAVAVHVRAVEEIHADFGGAVQRGNGLFLAAGQIETGQHHAAEAEGGDVEFSEFSLVHDQDGTAMPRTTAGRAPITS